MVIRRARRPCALCGTPVYSSAEDFGAAHEVEHRWRHIEHLLFSCPCITVPVSRAPLAVDVLRCDLYRATVGDPCARRVVAEAFPAGPSGAAVAAACSVPFCLDPVKSLRSSPGACGSTVARCSRIVAVYLLGVAARVCGPAAEDVAIGIASLVGVPRGSGVVSLLPGSCSGVSGSVSDDGSPLVGVCLCDLSAHRPRQHLLPGRVGAEADAHLGRA